MKRKKHYPQVRAFFATLGICFLICFMFMGTALVFVRTESIMSDRPKQVFSVVQQNGIREVTFFGEVYRQELSDEKKEYPPILYTLIPPELRVICGGMKIADECFPAEETNQGG